MDELSSLSSSTTPPHFSRFEKRREPRLSPSPLPSPRVPFSPRILSPAISPRVENLIARDGRVLIFSLLLALFLRPPPPPSSIKTGRDIERKRLLRDDAAADTESMELIYPRNRSLPARM